MKKELFNGKRLKIARVYRGKTVDQIAKETNINKKDILAFEDNKYKPTVENALKLSNVLYFPREYFYKNENLKISVEAIHFNPQSTTQRNEEISNKEKLIMIHKLYSFFEKFIQFPGLAMPDNLNRNYDMEELAIKCREYWGIENEPILNMVSFMESIGVVLTSINSDKKGASPYSQKQGFDGKFKYIVALGNDQNALAMRNYDLAYELGFIIYNELKVSAKKFNKDDFASAFLLPRETFEKELINPSDLESYINIKSKFMVPITICLYRAYALGIINYKKYNYLMNEMVKKGWQKTEPLDNVRATQPNSLKQAYNLLLENNILSKNTFIEKLNNEGMNLYPKDIEMLMGLKEGTIQDNNKGKVMGFNKK